MKTLRVLPSKTDPCCDPAGVDPRGDQLAPPAATVSGEALFLNQLSTIQSVLAAVARQHRFSPEDAEEFKSTALLRIIDHDYGVMRKFRGQCSWRTYLTVTVQRIYLDFRIAQWGKWRPSAVTRRGGDIAVLLERLTVRDGLTFGEACAVLEIDRGLTVDRDTLARIYSTFRRRVRPRLVSDAGLAETLPASDLADPQMANAVIDETMAIAIASLETALSALSAEDRLLLQLRFGDDMTVAEVARTLKCDQKGLYRRYERLLLTLRRDLEAAGICGRDVAASIGATDIDVVAHSLVACPAAAQ
jgi:RNA polymerase sigma factor (sigma-70 family)